MNVLGSPRYLIEALITIAFADDVTQEQIGFKVAAGDAQRLADPVRYLGSKGSIQGAIGFFHDSDLEHAQPGECDLLVDSQLLPGLQVLDKDAWYDVWMVIRQGLDHLAQHLYFQGRGLAGFHDQFGPPVSSRDESGDEQRAGRFDV
jgi:hypothetical protein